METVASKEPTARKQIALARPWLMWNYGYAPDSRKKKESGQENNEKVYVYIHGEKGTTWVITSSGRIFVN